MKKILTCFCYTDIHNQQSMLDYPTTIRRSLIQAKDLAIEEFGLADVAIVGGDNLSDYPHWNKSCALPKKNFLDIKGKLHRCISESVNKELYEAAVMDGAGFLRRAWRITIPGIGSIMILQLVRQIISIFQITQEPLAMTGGGPNNASTTLGLLAYRYAFKNFQVGNALALNVVMFLMLVVLTTFYFKLQNSIRKRSRLYKQRIRKH